MSIVMRFHSLGKLGLIVAAMLATGQPASAFDPQAARQQGACCDEAAITALREAARAYYSGDKREALTGLLTAAQSGHPAAQWKLGSMYAKGDGVTEDDVKAFGFFNELVSAHGDDAPTSPEAPFVANAFVKIGSYYLTGISNSTITPNVRRAREIFTYAASYFGNAEAQTKLGNMYLDGVGGDQNPRQAARWYLLAARKGQIEAQYKLGEMLVHGDQIDANPVVGLMWLTIALKQAALQRVDDSAIRSAHEEAFSLASEDERRQSISMAQQWLADNEPSSSQALNQSEPALAAAAQ